MSWKECDHILMANAECVQPSSGIIALGKEIDRLRARAKALEGALRPFAVAWGFFMAFVPSEGTWSDGTTYKRGDIKLGHLRTAARVHGELGE